MSGFVPSLRGVWRMRVLRRVEGVSRARWADLSFSRLLACRAEAPRRYQCSCLSMSSSQASLIPLAPAPGQLLTTSPRWHSSLPPDQDAVNVEVTFEELQEVVREDDVKVIDVREPQELERSGRIPNSINIPLRQVEVALNMTPTVYKKVYGAEQPDEEEEIIFTCQAGMRSVKAVLVARSLGFNKARHYPGGWGEWASRIGQ